MLFLSSLRADSSSHPSRSKQRSRRRRLSLEAMESRQLLAVLVDTFADVTNASDGLTSLREAIAQAAANPGADTILVPAGHYKLNSPLTINDASGPLIIRAEGGTATIDAGTPTLVNRRAFNVTAASQVEMEGLTITGGVAINGGGIHNAGTLTLIDSIIESNSATQLGAGIYNVGVLTINDSLLSDNHAERDGAAIYNLGGSVTIAGSQFSENHAVRDGAAIYTSGGTVMVAESQISGNHADRNGGALYNQGGVLPPK
jgi:hypothetical protein